MNIKTKVSSADRSNLGSIGAITCSLILGAHKFKLKFIAWKNLLCPAIFQLDFAQDFRVGRDWNS